MKLQTLSAIVFLSSILTTGKSQSIIPFSDKRWKIEAQGQMVEFYKGYECLYLKAGRATLPDVQFLNGIIEFDICLTEQVSFSGFFFRQRAAGQAGECIDMCLNERVHDPFDRLQLSPETRCGQAVRQRGGIFIEAEIEIFR